MTTLLVIIVAFFLPMLFLLARTTRRRRTCASKLPPGPMGIPILGDNLGFLLALWTDRLAEWAGRRVDKYGPVSKLSLFGAPTVLLAGPAASKFVFTSDAFVSEQLKPFKRMIGERTITQLAGGEHRRLRGAIAQFLRLDMMKKYVGRVDEEVRHHIAANWAGRDRVTVVPLAKASASTSSARSSTTSTAGTSGTASSATSSTSWTASGRRHRPPLPQPEQDHQGLREGAGHAHGDRAREEGGARAGPPLLQGGPHHLLDQPREQGSRRGPRLRRRRDHRHLHARHARRLRHLLRPHHLHDSTPRQRSPHSRCGGSRARRDSQ
ncbi:cytochrome P450 716B1-like [Iris pallida]|uniref:Cytochrome P450 716B1-like n=1 Tax=Iris pallida TaxID=29817 RepID=A0AAX6DX63_IRIPA|nr:cytochrome P450 716B1-like [Iris pallida]